MVFHSQCRARYSDREALYFARFAQRVSWCSRFGLPHKCYPRCQEEQDLMHRLFEKGCWRLMTNNPYSRAFLDSNVSRNWYCWCYFQFVHKRSLWFSFSHEAANNWDEHSERMHEPVLSTHDFIYQQWHGCDLLVTSWNHYVMKLQQIWWRERKKKEKKKDLCFAMCF